MRALKRATLNNFLSACAFVFTLAPKLCLGVYKELNNIRLKNCTILLSYTQHMHYQAELGNEKINSPHHAQTNSNTNKSITKAAHDDDETTHPPLLASLER